MRVAKLIKVEGDANNNKFYNMTENADGTFTAEYGRVGAKNPQTKTYPMSKWHSTLNSKLRASKGYTDITDMVSVTKSSSDLIIEDAQVSDFVAKLRGYANNSISENYLVGSDAVTQVQLDESQRILNTISSFGKKKLDKASVDEINQLLTKVFTTIPRKMGKVKDYLLPFDGKDTVNHFTEIVTREQDTLDVMSGQVITSQDFVDTDEDSSTLEAAFGLTMIPVNPDEEAMIKKMMARTNNENQYKRAFKVVNKKTQALYDLNLQDASNKTTELFWHGSRNENWWSILNQGLLIRPTNAVHNGSMFGDSIYFANKAQKSIGYTSSRGSYWARGSSNTGILALYSVQIGNQYHIHRHNSSHYRLNWQNLRKLGDYDSVYAHGGADLRNDEFMVYRSQQCSISYLIEFSG